ncbi:MAG: hypothetical protein JNK29_10210, partial [Anaerolineales bacterium]|nr:hypothetical protein [Anaerolineales bacterium]
QVSVASLADTIYVLGPVAAGATPPAGATLAVYLPLAQTWQTFAADPQLPLLAGSGLVAVEAEIHNLGGRQGAAPSPRHLAFQAIFTTLLPAIGK